METFELSQLVLQQQGRNHPYLEFLRVPSLSAGLYVLAAGAVDLQGPHAEDEVYYVVGGSAVIQVGEEERTVQAGTVVFVGAGVEHRFHTIEKDLTVLVFFAPPEGSCGASIN